MKSARQFVRLTLSLILGLAGAALPAQDAAPKTNTPAPLTSTEYRLLPKDQITFSIDEDPINTGQSEPLAVSSQGEVQIPVSRGYDKWITVLAKGKTLRELESEVKTELEKGYYKQATIHMRLVGQSRQVGKVMFYGRVRGTIALAPGEQKWLSAAILELGYDEFADLKRVKLHRIDPVTKKNKTIIIDVKEILRTNDRSKDLILQDDDRVEVPERGILF